MVKPMPDLHAFVTELFSKLGVSTDSIALSEGPRTVVRVQSPDAQAIVGQDGESLRALNTIARRMVEKKHGEEAANFLIDINDYHENQLEVVRKNALMLAQRARLFKHDVELPPMSSYERLVVHELFADDAEIKTESAGEGKFRHIVLKYKAGATAGA